MILGIASDHAGFDEKKLITPYLIEQGYEVVDYGPASDDRVDYPDYAEKVARALAAGDIDRGILICGTGIGMAIAANKIAGIRAANAINPEFAALAREHNDANIITLSGRFVEDATNKKIVDTFLTTEFGGGRHTGRVSKIARLEEEPTHDR